MKAAPSRTQERRPAAAPRRIKTQLKLTAREKSLLVIYRTVGATDPERLRIIDQAVTVAWTGHPKKTPAEAHASNDAFGRAVSQLQAEHIGGEWLAYFANVGKQPC
jgi:hypothetical protein